MKNNALWFSLLVLLTGCGLPFRVQTPNDFARAEEPPSPWQYRSVSAYGVALAVRTEKNEGSTSLDFWAEAIDRTLRKGTAYNPAGMTDVTSPNGVKGRRLEYTYGNPENSSVYVVVLFVTSARVFVLESGGAKEAFDRARAGIDASIRQFTPDR